MKKTKHINKIKFLSIAVMGVGFVGSAQKDWDNIPVPANAGEGQQWELQEDTSDDFNYKFDAVNRRTNFGDGKWYNFYHNQWDGPGTTYWKNNHVSVEDGSLKLTASRWNKNNQSNPQYPYPGAPEAHKMGLPNNGVNSGCVTSNSKVKFPVFVESAISVANIELASCFWLLSPDDTQEIDIIENYGGVPGFNHVTHISHHSFIRNPFHDYQPRDWNSWWPDARVNPNYGWGDWAWNNGNRRFLRLGVNWISPKHFEYYVDGEIVRVLYNDALATRMNGTWEYTYYNQQNPANTRDSFGNNVGGMPINYTSGNRNGYSQVTLHATSAAFDFSKLEEASKASNGINVVDPGKYQNGRGFHKEMDIIINVESQSWLVSRGLTPSDANLQDKGRNSMLVDWVRVYKPIKGANQPKPLAGGTLTGGPYTFTVGDGIADNVSGVSVSGNQGPNSGWIVTDEALNILGTPPSPDKVNFDEAGAGVCLIWHISYEDGLQGLAKDGKIADLKGNYKLSTNSVRVNRNAFVAPVVLSGGTLTGGPYTFTVGDGIVDNVSGVSVSGNEGPNSGWVVTDEALNILGTPPSPDKVNFDEAGAGVCLIWHISYEDGLEGLSAGGKIADLKGKYDLSDNSVTVNRNPFVAPVVLSGGTLTGGPYTFTVGDGIADNVSGVSVSGNEGPNSGWVVTDEALNILGTPPSPDKVNFDEAGEGVCLIWHISYEDGLEGLSAGGKIADLKGKYDLSDNSVTVNRNPFVAPVTLNGGTLTGGPYTFTVGDGIADNVSGVSVSGNQGPNFGWVVTDEALNILGTPPSPDKVNFDEAGEGVCLIWHISYEDGLEGLAQGGKIADLKGNYKLSTNSVRVNRNAFVAPVVLSGGTLTGGPYTFTVGDGIADNVSGVSVSGNEGPNSGWVVTDEDLNILGTPPSPDKVNFDEAGEGVCLIWHISYENGLEGLNTGSNIADLEGNYDISDNNVKVYRNAFTGPVDEIPVDATVIQAEDYVATGGRFDGWRTYTTHAGIEAINFNQTGDWAEYTVTIKEKGLYDLTYFVGTILDNTAISLYIDGIFVAKTDVYNNKDWDTFVKLPLASPFNIGVGEHTVRLVGSGTSSTKYEWNMDYFVVTKVGDFVEADVVDMDIEAESFVKTGGDFRGVRKYTTIRGVTGTNFNQTGDWAEYNVTIPKTGEYNVTYYISTPIRGAAIEFIVDGKSIMRDAVPNNRSWDRFIPLQANQKVFLTAGAHTIRLLGAGTSPVKWEWNLDRFNLSNVDTAGAKELDTINADLIKITPNPVVDFFNVIGLETGVTLNYAIVDMLGGIVKTGVIANDNNEITGLSGLAQGVYFVEIYNESGFKKVIKVLKN
ncbi:carbohydrate-binding protein [Aquimarina agarilytica]|uniref:carbohydrate-binding protein n=1 Tax=Aquimarina agarilytica TaxID=1087449 RepID=UPI00028829D0|nr:carbohydrate-binding protein [Aquimarina agarilytica]